MDILVNITNHNGGIVLKTIRVKVPNSYMSFAYPDQYAAEVIEELLGQEFEVVERGE